MTPGQKVASFYRQDLQTSVTFPSAIWCVKTSYFLYLSAVCAPVGAEDPHIIPNAQITASSYYLSYYPHMGRLNDVKGWLRKLLQSPMTTYKLIWERFTQSAQSQRKGRNLLYIILYNNSHLLMKAAGVYITFEFRGKLSTIRCAFLTNDSTRTN